MLTSHMVTDEAVAARVAVASYRVTVPPQKAVWRESSQSQPVAMTTTDNAILGGRGLSLRLFNTASKASYLVH